MDDLVCNFNKLNILLYIRSYIHACISSFNASIHTLFHGLHTKKLIFFIKLKKKTPQNLHVLVSLAQWICYIYIYHFICYIWDFSSCTMFILPCYAFVVWDLDNTQYKFVTYHISFFVIIWRNIRIKCAIQLKY